MSMHRLFIANMCNTDNCFWLTVMLLPLGFVPGLSATDLLLKVDLFVLLCCSLLSYIYIYIYIM